MANYSYQQSSYSSGGGAGADSAFSQADSNQDGRVDLNEFRNFIGKLFKFWCMYIIDNKYYYLKDKTLVPVEALVTVQPLVSVEQVLQATNHLHSNHQAPDLVVLLVVLEVMKQLMLVVLVVLPVVQAVMKHLHSNHQALDLVVMQV